jgi:hypothetical protein
MCDIKLCKDLAEQIRVVQRQGTAHYGLESTAANVDLLGRLGVYEQDQYPKDHPDFADDLPKGLYSSFELAGVLL